MRRQSDSEGLIVGRRGDGRIMILQPTADDDATIGDMIVVGPGFLRELIVELSKHLASHRVVLVRRR